MTAVSREGEATRAEYAVELVHDPDTIRKMLEPDRAYAASLSPSSTRATSGATSGWFRADPVATMRCLCTPTPGSVTRSSR